jgi:hypothetical protein
MRKDRVNHLINVSRAHDEQIKRDGFKATPASDRLREQYDKLRADATPEEIATFERIEF